MLINILVAVLGLPTISEKPLVIADCVSCPLVLRNTGKSTFQFQLLSSINPETCTVASLPILAAPVVMPNTLFLSVAVSLLA